MKNATQYNSYEPSTWLVAIILLLLVSLGSLLVYFSTDWDGLERANSWCKSNGYGASASMRYCLEHKCVMDVANNIRCNDNLIEIPLVES